MRFRLEIESGNAAFEDDAKAAVAEQILLVALRLNANADEGIIRDINGNKVGSWTFEGDDEHAGS